MFQAVIVNQITKRYSTPNLPQWKRAPRAVLRGSNYRNKMDSWYSQAYDPRREMAVLDHVSFEVEQGEICSLLGKRGSGKTTLVRLLAGLLSPDSGWMQVFGYDVVHQSAQALGLMNRIAAANSFFKQWTPLQNLVYSARLYGLDVEDARRTAEEVFPQLGFSDADLQMPMELLSRALQHKAYLASAVLARPRLLLLDEPTLGLDVVSQSEVYSLLRHQRDMFGTTVLFATQNEIEAQTLCDRIVLLEGGQVTSVTRPLVMQSAAAVDDFAFKMARNEFAFDHAAD